MDIPNAYSINASNYWIVTLLVDTFDDNIPSHAGTYQRNGIPSPQVSSLQEEQSKQNVILHRTARRVW